jgi:hypothetical protein
MTKTTPSAPATPRTPRIKSLGLLALAAALGLGLWLYSQPDIVIMLSEQLWSCF